MDIAVTDNHELPPAVLERLPGGDLAAAPDGPAAGWTSYQETPTLAGLLRLLGDPTRLKLLFLLVGGERSVMDLSAEAAIPQPSVSHHLAWLRASDLVVPRRDGKRVFYDLGPAVQHDGRWLMLGPVRIRLDTDG